MSTIAVDVMSGDHGPRVCVPAAVSLLREHEDLSLTLVGDPEAIRAQLAALDHARDERLEIHPASQVVAMDEHPREALRRKKDSSMRRAIELVKSAQAAAC